MKNENLSYKIRELLEISDESDPEWDPDKYWDLFEARKRRQQRWALLTYSLAAMVIFALTYIVFVNDSNNRYIKINAQVSGIPKGTKPLHITNNASERTLLSDANTDAKPIDFAANTKSEISHVIISNKKSKASARITFRKRVNLPFNNYFANEQIMDLGVPASNKGNDQLPSLLHMFQQAQKERELRNLSVQLEDRENYNGFWLTVNQHLLTNKLNSDQLHYQRY